MILSILFDRLLSMNEEERDIFLKKILELEAQVIKLQNDLMHDSLTGLKTRKFFEEEANIYLSDLSTVSTNKRKDWFCLKNLSFLSCDIDHFKKINTTYGFPAGDSVLKEVAKAIMQSLRSGDVAVRWGGEEMLVMLLGTDEAQAKTKAEDIRKKVERLFFESTDALKVTVSIGVASVSGAITHEELVKRANLAMYRAKETGRNKVVTYSELSK